MNGRFVCHCGFTLISYDSSLREVVCPDCEKILTAEGVSPIEEHNRHPKHGLWKLIRERKTESNESLHKLPQNDEIEEKPSSSTYKSLWETMKTETRRSSDQLTAPIRETHEPAPAVAAPPQGDPKRPETEEEIVKLDTEPEEWAAEIEPVRHAIPSYKPKPAPRTAIVGSLVGTLAILASPLGMLEHFIFKFPATFIALIGLILSLQAWNDLARTRGPRKGGRLASYGVICGVLGMLLGPTVFSWWGNRLRDNTGQFETENHLEQIGNALDEFHSQKHHFPIGGTYSEIDGEPRTPMHGWMTALLPHMENHEQQVYRNIDFSLPYDHPKNRQAMSTEIPNFYAAGSSREKLNGEFAVTHFSGVGSMYAKKGINIGIFHRDVAVSRSDIKDGLSNTLVVGEIAHFFPAWGSPDNWRSVRDGLNKDRMGFGNAKRTGAMFLHADGSVKFYSNATSAKLLQNLSTRNGRE